MATKTISATYADGYSFNSAAYDALYITSYGTIGVPQSGMGSSVYGVGGAGEFGANAADVAYANLITNHGEIDGGQGGVGGTGLSGARPARGGTGGQGGIGLYQSEGELNNFGRIIGGAGGAGGVGKGAYGGGNYFPGYGGNGGDGGFGVFWEGTNATIVNSSRIQGGAGGYGYYGGVGGPGLRLPDGSLLNTGLIIGGAGGGSAAGPTAEGGVGVEDTFGATVTNRGQISVGAGGPGLQPAVWLINGGALINGAGDVYATIYGGVGVSLTNGGTVTNFGTIKGSSGTAVAFGSSSDELVVEPGCDFSGLVRGGGGTLDLAGGTGTILGMAAGTLSVSGVVVSATEFDNFSDIDASGSFVCKTDGTLTSTQTLGVYGSFADDDILTTFGTLNDVGTVNVYGTLIDEGRLVVNLGKTLNVLNGGVLEAQGGITNLGKMFLASTSSMVSTDLKALAAGATLSGGGTLTLFGPKARILGATASATLTNADNTILGAGSVGVADMTLINQASGVIEATGLLTVRDAAGHSLTNAGLMEANATGTLALVAETINQAGGGRILAADGLVTLQSVDVIGGTLTTTGAGRVNVNGGGATLDGGAIAVTNAGLLQDTAGQTLTLEGSVINSGKLNLLKATLLIAATGSTLSGAGQVNLNNNATNVIVGATAGATLTNVNDRIDGAGLLGAGLMALVNQAGGVILGNQNLALTIDTGANTILNAGLIENVGKGGTLVKSAVNNTGTLLAATAGTLNLAGAVIGAGVANINGGTLYVQQAFAEKVTFTGTTGVLELGASQAFTGKVVGLSKTGTNWLDLVDIGFFSAKTKATYSGTTASGTLTVTDGTHTAHIALQGNYLAAIWTLSGDGHGGTKVVDPSSGAAPLAQAISALPAAPAPGPAAWTPRPPPRLFFAHAQT